MSDRTISPQRREEIIGALRRGTVPRRSLDAFAVGLDPLTATLDEELDRVRQGSAMFKAIRGEYGSGKTFFARWFQERAKRKGFATTEVQISETETPLHRLETVYRRAIERISTADTLEGAFRSIIDGWFYALEEEVIAEGRVDSNDAEDLARQTESLMERRLSHITKATPQFQLALRAYRKAQLEGNHAVADGLITWLSGQPNAGMKSKKAAGIKGDIDHFGALSFLQGLLGILRDSGFSGLVLVLDEVETLQRVRSDVREKSLNALRQLIDEIDGGRFPGLYLMITGTPAFFEGPQGVRRLEPLAQRLHVDFNRDARFDNPRAVQLRLQGFDMERLVEVGCTIRDLFVEDSKSPDRVRQKADDAYIRDLAAAVIGDLGGKVGISPRVFLKKLVGEVLDVIDVHEEFEPRRDYKLTLAREELSRVEREALTPPPGATSADDIELDL